MKFHLTRPVILDFKCRHPVINVFQHVSSWDLFSKKGVFRTWVWSCHHPLTLLKLRLQQLLMWHHTHTCAGCGRATQRVSCRWNVEGCALQALKQVLAAQLCVWVARERWGFTVKGVRTAPFLKCSNTVDKNGGFGWAVRLEWGNVYVFMTFKVRQGVNLQLDYLNKKVAHMKSRWSYKCI